MSLEYVGISLIRLHVGGIAISDPDTGFHRSILRQRMRVVHHSGGWLHFKGERGQAPICFLCLKWARKALLLYWMREYPSHKLEQGSTACGTVGHISAPSWLQGMPSLRFSSCFEFQSCVKQKIAPLKCWGPSQGGKHLPSGYSQCKSC